MNLHLLSKLKTKMNRMCFDDLADVYISEVPGSIPGSMWKNLLLYPVSGLSKIRGDNGHFPSSASFARLKNESMKNAVDILWLGHNTFAQIDGQIRKLFLAHIYKY